MAVAQQNKHPELNAFYNSYNEEFSKQHLKYFNTSLQQLKDFLFAYKKRLEKLNKLNISDLRSYSQLKDFNHSILNQLQNCQDNLNTYTYKNIWEESDKDLLNYIQNQKRYLRVKEAFNGYSINTRTNIPLFLRKISVNTSLILKKRKKRFYNFFRRLFKKELLDLQSYRRRRIPFQSMLKAHFSNGKNETQLELVQYFMEVKSQVLLKVWEFDEALEERLQNSQTEEDNPNVDEIINIQSFEQLLGTLIEKLTEAGKHCQKEIENMFLNSVDKMDQQLKIVDTPDLPLNKFKSSLINQVKESIIDTNDLQLKKWENTHKTLLDDWMVDVEIMYLYFSVLDNFAKLHKRIYLFISQNLNVNIEAIRNYLNESALLISETSGLKELKSTLKAEKHRNNDEFVEKLLSKTIGKLSGNINNDIENFKKQTKLLVSEISEKRGFVKSKNYEKGIKSSEINWLSVQELLQFEAIPRFNASIEEVENFVANHMEKARLKLVALGTVSDFSLESAMIMIDDKKGNIAECKQVVIEGYDRAKLHLEEALEQMDLVKESPLQNLQTAINEFNTNIQKLKNTDNILELNIKIAKIKTIERSKKLRKKLWNFIINFIPETVEFIKKKFFLAKEVVNDLNKKLGVVTEKTQISHELSDFLGKTEKALKKLPFVYQRLFQLRPTDDERFFVGREEELKKLFSGYANWQKDHFITTAIIGEKGNGTTSLIMYFLKQSSPDISIIHHEVTGKIYLEKDFYKLFSKLFKHDGFQSTDEIINYINDLPDKQIIILENLQHLFIKKVKGFICQKMLFDLMTSTSKKIFWIGTYTTYSWQYLEKTLNISSVYINEIHLQRFSDESLEEIILKRNYLSGYQIEFEESKNHQNSKTYQKLKDSEKQSYLKKSFFKELNQMSNGNVSLSQLYWLRSTLGIFDEKIRIKSLNNFDVSFDKDISSSYLFALHAILVHDGLNIQDYAQVFKNPEYICRNDLIPMLEKGLLIKPKEKYNINPIIFRKAVQLLQSHNFIN